MSTLQKISYYISLHPYEGPALDSESLLEALVDYLPSHLIILRFEETNILQEEFIAEKVQQLFEQAGRPESLQAFLTYWIQRDDKLLVDCLEWEEMLNQMSSNNTEELADEMVALVVNEIQTKVTHHKKQNVIMSDGDLIRARLLKLYEFYTKKQDRTLQTLTFEEMTTQIKKMSLNTWMHFCKDCNITSLLGKQEVHQAFRKNTIKQMNFDQFEQGLIMLLEKIHPNDINSGWKMISVFDEEMLRHRMVCLGVPASTGAPQPIPPSKILANIFNLPELKPSPISATEKPAKPRKKKKIKSAEDNDLESLNLDKLARLKLDVPLMVEQDSDDELFLGEYMIQKPREDLYSTKMKRKKKPQVSSRDQGIINRLDQRMQKYARS